MKTDKINLQEIAKQLFGDKVKKLRLKAERLFGWRHKERWFYYQLEGMDGRRTIIHWAIEWFLTMRETDYKSFEYFWLMFGRVITEKPVKLSLIEQIEIDFLKWKSMTQTT